MDLKTITGVEILSTGRYALESGEAEFTADHLADAVRAATDPTIVAPRVKLGHDFEKVFGDAAPAFGKVVNMRLANNGQKIVGDLVDVPASLAASIAACYPGRSVEGGFDFDAPSGNSYKLVISDLALLGTQWPGVTNLKDLTAEDLLDLVNANGQIEHPVEVDDRYKLSGGMADRVVTAKLADPKRVEAKLNVADFRRVFARDLREGRVPALDGTDQSKWWARSVEAGDDDRLNLVIDDEAGHLIELPIAVEGEGLKYDGPRFREAVAASSGSGSRVLASWPSEGGSPTNEERQSMKREEMLKRLGLSEDASDETIVQAMADKPDALTAETPGDGGDGGDGGEEGTGTEEGDGSGSGTEEGAERAEAIAKLKADGFVVVDGESFEQIKAGAQAGLSLAEQAKKSERDTTISAAIGAGKFSVGRRGHFEKSWDADPEGTKALIASLAPGLVPVSEVGRAGTGEDAADTATEDAIVAAFEAHMLPELANYEGSVLARAKANNGGAS